MNGYGQEPERETPEPDALDQARLRGGHATNDTITALNDRCIFEGYVSLGLDTFCGGLDRITDYNIEFCEAESVDIERACRRRFGVLAILVDYHTAPRERMGSLSNYYIRLRHGKAMDMFSQYLDKKGLSILNLDELPSQEIDVAIPELKD
jgi:hypothetical protein